ncbi:hypothetical protein ACKI1J_11480 [Streptomyces scabiei]|uniref:hypothetical protein n=1 Tax=Streptomyces scabiei TaxID=1930 RepID=UPI0038F68AB1
MAATLVAGEVSGSPPDVFIAGGDMAPVSRAPASSPQVDCPWSTQAGHDRAGTIKIVAP